MKKNLIKYKKPLLAGVLLIVLLAAYGFKDKWLPFIIKPKASDSKTPSTKNSTISSNQDNNEVVLKLGSRGAKVSELQQLLNAKHRANLPQILDFLVVDGNFGPKTEFMLKKWTGKTSITIVQLVQDLK